MIDAWIVLLAAPLIAFLGVIVGQLIPEYFGRRRMIRDRYDAAIRAVAEEQAARQGVGLNIPEEYLKAVDSAAHATLEQELSVEAVRRFLEAAAEARAALAALYPYSPDLEPYWNKFEIPEREMHDLIDLLQERRNDPLTRHSAAGAQRLGH